MGMYGGGGIGEYGVVVTLINDPERLDGGVADDRGLWCARLVTVLAIRYPAGLYIPSLGMVGLDAFQGQIVEEEFYAVGFAGGVPGEPIGGLETGDPIPGHVADLPDDMVPFVVAKDQRSLAFLPKKRGQLFLSVVI